MNLMPNTSTFFYKIQMKNMSGLDELPTFTYVHHKYEITKDFQLKHLSVAENYKATMGITVDISNTLETDFYPERVQEIPGLEDKLEYKLEGEE